MDSMVSQDIFECEDDTEHLTFGLMAAKDYYMTVELEANGTLTATFPRRDGRQGHSQGRIPAPPRANHLTI